MKRSALWILFLGFALFGAQIDVDLLTKIAKKDPSDIKTRLLLAKYHIQKHNYDKADIYISQILKNDPKNKIAKELQKKLKRIKVLNELLKEYGVKNPDDKKEIEKLFQKLFQNREYKKVTIFYKLLSSQNISLNDKSKLISLRSFLKIGEIKEAQNLKESIKTPLYRYEAKGDIYFYKKDYPKAKQNYIKALKISYDKDTLANLLNTLYIQKDYEKYKTLLKLIEEKYKNDFDTEKLHEKLNTLKKELLTQLKRAYEKKRDFISLKAYASSAFDMKKEKEAVKATKEFIKENPSNIDAKILLAKMFLWRQEYKEALDILRPIKDKNQETLSLYANTLFFNQKYKEAVKYLKMIKEKTPIIYKRILLASYWSGDKEEARRLFPKVAKMLPNDENLREIELYLNEDVEGLIKLYQEKVKKNPKDSTSLFELATLYQKKGDEEKAFEYFKKYYKITKNTKIGKYLAQYLYLHSRYKEAVFYFKDTLKRELKKKKEDPLFLYQYAISLQHLGDYEKAARIYGKLSNNKKDKNYLDIKYRYALSLLKTNKESNRKKAKKILKSLKEELKNSSKKEAKELLKYTNQAYEIANKELLKPKRYKDIVLAEGLQKQYQEYNSTKEAVNTLEAVALKIDKNKDLKKILPKDENNKSSKRKKIKNIDIKTHYLKDSNNIKAKSAGVKISNIASIKNRKIDLYGERFSFENHKKTDGFKIKATLKNKNIKISLGLNKFKDYNDPYASLEYERAIFNHILKIAIERQNALFYENAPYMEKKRISALNLLVRDYIKMIDDKELDIEFTLSRYKDKNIRFTPSFYYLLSKKRIKNVTNSLALAGWYQFYKNRDRHYAYLKKDDATRAEIQSNIPITERLSISPRISAGYSFFNKSALLGYGILMDYRINDYSFISIDCSKHQTKAKSKSSDYNYKECYGDIYYRW